MEELPRREKQILDGLYRKGSATVAELIAVLSDPPGYSAVRAMLGRLERKGYVSHREEGRAFIYRPTTPATTASRSALRHVVRTFFQGSAVQAVSAILDLNSRALSPAELKDLKEAIRRAECSGR